MPDPVMDYETAADGFARVLEQCDDLTVPTPCKDWTAQDIVDHVVGGTSYYTDAWGGKVPDLATDVDLAARYRALAAALADTCRQPGVLEQMVPSPLGSGELLATMMLGIYTADTLIHTWDLARAVGTDAHLDQDLLQRTWDGMLPMEAALRRPEVFGPAIEIDHAASMQDRAMAWFGRQP